MSDPDATTTTSPPTAPPALEGEQKATPQDAAAGQMSFFDHLRELRTRMVRCLIALAIGFFSCYAWSKELFDILIKPLVKVFPPGGALIYTALPEAFVTYMKVSLVAGCLAVSPYLFYQLWSFIAPGLYKEEKVYLIPIAFFSAFFFVSGAMFGYYVVFPFAFQFFMEYASETIKPMPSLAEYFSFSLKMLFAFGVIFELPLFIFFLARIGLVTPKILRKFRRYAILLAFIVGAILTPPDVISQCLMALPLLILYELSIVVAVVFGKKKPEAEEKKADEATDAEKKTEEQKETQAG
jgi:sec-independent protein translocase protein TatC